MCDGESSLPPILCGGSDECHMSGFGVGGPHRSVTNDDAPLVAPAKDAEIMLTRNTFLSTAIAGALITSAGLVAAGPAIAAPAVTPMVASTASVPSMTMGQMAITIENFAYSEAGTVSPGSLISVTNNDTEVHTVTADNGAFDVTVPGGETVTFAAPAEGGTYSFFCTFHANMKGAFTVAAGAAAPTPAAPMTPPPPSTQSQPEMTEMEGMDQMGAVPKGGADTGAGSAVNDASGALLLGGGLVLAALVGGTYVVRRRATTQ